MSNRIDIKLSELIQANKTMLSPYITAGDPHPDVTVDIMHQLVASGADVIELGIPFSDPMAEGPVIQSAMERALSHNVCCEDVLNMVKEFRMKDDVTPIVLMGYLNPIEQYGYEKFAKNAKHAGVDGTILVDLPPEESQEVTVIWKQQELHLIFLCSPTTTENRMKAINDVASGYLYYVSLKGVTGANSLNLDAVKDQYQHRKAQTHLPLMVGFGIKTPEMASKVAEFADGVIVGAALIEALQENQNIHKIQHKEGIPLIRDMRSAIDNKRA